MSDGAESELIGQQFGNYRIIAPIGVGGMGRVFRARHLHLEREVAVKLLHPHLASDSTFRARFLQEARAASLLDHPHIVQLYDYGEQGDLLYLIMELLTNGSLRTFLREQHDANSVESYALGLDLLHQAAEGLSYAHGRGMVHRDVKPDNLLLKRETGSGGGETLIVKVGDFGLARLADAAGFTGSGVAVGTPAYMSPEQCQGREVDHRSDIYSLGIVLYEFAAGRPPFTAKSLSEAIYNHVYVAPPSPGMLRSALSPRLEAVILRCLAKHPDDRFPTMEHLSNELVMVLAELESGPDQSDAAVATPAPVPPVAVPDLASRDLPANAGAVSGVHLPRVFVIGPDDTVLTVAPLTGNGLTIGRLEDNDLTLTEPGVSRHHLLIDWNGTHATVTDLGSSNGTLLDGVTLPPQVPRPWNPQEELRVGPLRLRMALPVTSAATAVAMSSSVDMAAEGVSGGESAPAAVGAQAGLPPGPPRGLSGGVWVEEPRGRRKMLSLVVIVAVIAVAAGVFFLSGGDDSPASSVADAATATPALAPTATTAIASLSATPALSQLVTATVAETTPALAAATAVAGTSGDITPGGSPVTVTVVSPGEPVSLRFTAVAGQRVSLETTDLTFGPTTAYAGRVSIVASNGAVMASASLWVNDDGAFIDATSLLTAGAYDVRVEPDASLSGSVTITLRDVPPDVVAAIQPDGQPVTITTTHIAQNARLTFSASTGQRVFLELRDVTIGPTAGYAGRVSIVADNGAQLSSSSVWVTEDLVFIDTTELASAGEYAIVIDPDRALTGSATVRLLDVPPDPVAVIAIGEAPVTLTTTTPGQNAVLTFTASAGQSVTVTVTGITIGPTAFYAGRVSLLDGSQTSLGSSSLWVSEPRSQIADVVLATGGTYTILIDPDSMLTGSVTVSLTTEP
jgi:tRNA A-37 threonylcarbamoyl transferase component Bud32